MEKEIIKEYTNGELTIVWKPKLCIHSGECVKALPNVYHPGERPWITIDKATTQELKDQIAKCPSGALSYYLNNVPKEAVKNQETEVEVTKNGPLLIRGTLKVSHHTGGTEIRDNVTAFCRCGGSGNKPYCDGTHKTIHFQG